MKNNIVVVLSAISICLTSCAVGPDYKRPEISIPAKFENETSARIEFDDRWWETFSDPQLNFLVESALESNLDIKIAENRVESAISRLEAAGVVLYPTINASGGGQKSKRTEYSDTPFPGDTRTTSYTVGFSLNYALNFWGRAQRSIEAASASVQSLEWQSLATRLGISGLVVQNYIALCALDSQIALAEKSLASYRETVGLVEKQAEGGIASALEVNLALSAQAITEAQLLELQRQRQLTENVIAEILGVYTLDIQTKHLSDLYTPSIPVHGVPSDLLDRRPDILSAEQQLKAANANIGYAKAALYPSITLSSGAGYESAELGDLFKSGASIWNIGAYIDLPIFDAGKRKAAVAASTAEHRAVLNQYAKVIATAFREVSDALVNIEYLDKSKAAYSARLEASKRALQNATNRYESGYSSYLTLLESQRNANDAESAIVTLNQTKLQALANLMLALGGGFIDQQPKSSN